MTQQSNDRFLALLGNVLSVFSVGWGTAAGNTATIFMAFVLFHLSMRLAKEVGNG